MVIAVPLSHPAPRTQGMSGMSTIKTLHTESRKTFVALLIHSTLCSGPYLRYQTHPPFTNYIENTAFGKKIWVGKGSYREFLGFQT